MNKIIIDKEMAKQIIIDHYENPKTKINKKPRGCYLKGHNDSPSCIDNIDSYVLIDKNKIKDVKFSGTSCAICTSSTDLIGLKIKNKTIKQAKKIIDNYLNMIFNKKYDQKILDELNIYKNINKHLNRIKCATVGILAIKKAIDKYKND